MTAFSITIDLPMPPSVNALYANVAGKGRVKTKAYKSWLEEARWHVLTTWRAAGKPTAPSEAPMRLSVRLGLRERKRDCSNTIKAIEDVLVKELPIPDDRWNDEGHWQRCDNVPEGVARVTIETI